MTVQKLPPFTLLDVTVSSPAEMIAALDAVAPAAPAPAPRSRSWRLIRLIDGRTRLIIWGKPAGTYPTRDQAVAIRNRLLAAKGEQP